MSWLDCKDNISISLIEENLENTKETEKKIKAFMSNDWKHNGLRYWGITSNISDVMNLAGHKQYISKLNVFKLAVQGVDKNSLNVEAYDN